MIKNTLLSELLKVLSNIQSLNNIRRFYLQKIYSINHELCHLS